MEPVTVRSDLSSLACSVPLADCMASELYSPAFRDDHALGLGEEVSIRQENPAACLPPYAENRGGLAAVIC